MARKPEPVSSVTVKIENWKRFHPRTDVKKPSWFRLDYGLVEDEDFYDFTHEEFKVWIYLLSRACRKNTDTIRVSYSHAERVARLSRKAVDSAIEKLSELQMITASDTQTLRERDGDVTDADATRHDMTEQDKTGQDRTASATPARGVFDFEEVYSRYPRKINPAEGKKRAAQVIQTREDFEKLSRAVDRYRAYCTREQIPDRYRMHFSTFIEKRGEKPYVQPWRDWLDPETGKAAAPAPPSPSPHQPPVFKGDEDLPTEEADSEAKAAALELIRGAVGGKSRKNLKPPSEAIKKPELPEDPSLREAQEKLIRRRMEQGLSPDGRPHFEDPTR